MTAVEILKAGRELLVHPRGARRACCCSWCIVQKAGREAEKPDHRRAVELLDGGFIEVTGVEMLQGHNASDHPTILRAWDRAIELAETK